MSTSLDRLVALIPAQDMVEVVRSIASPLGSQPTTTKVALIEAYILVLQQRVEKGKDAYTHERHLTSRLMDLDRRIADLTEVNESLHEENKELEDENDDLEDEVSGLKDKVKDLEYDLRAREDEVDEVRSERDDLEHRLSSLRDDYYDACEALKMYEHEEM